MENTEDTNIDYDQGTVSAVDLHDSVRRENPLLPQLEKHVFHTVCFHGQNHDIELIGFR